MLPGTSVVALSDLCYLPWSSDFQKGQSDQSERLIAVRRVMQMKDDTSHKALDFSCKIFVKVYLYVHLFEHDASVMCTMCLISSIQYVADLLPI